MFSESYWGGETTSWHGEKTYWHGSGQSMGSRRNRVGGKWFSLGSTEIRLNMHVRSDLTEGGRG